MTRKIVIKINQSLTPGEHSIPEPLSNGEMRWNWGRITSLFVLVTLSLLISAKLLRNDKPPEVNVSLITPESNTKPAELLSASLPGEKMAQLPDTKPVLNNSKEITIRQKVKAIKQQKKTRKHIKHK